MNENTFLPVMISLLIGYLASSFLSKLFVIFFVQNALKIKRVRIKISDDGKIVINGTLEEAQMILVIEKIGKLGLNASLLLMALMVIIFEEVFLLKEVVIIFSLLTIVMSSFIVCVAMMDRLFFRSLCD